jgi:uncharacterized protein (TIGR04255 family)
MAVVADIGPDYEHPPVVETVLGVQFDRLPLLKNAHLGAFWKRLGESEWPSVSDLPPLIMQFEQFDSSGAWAERVQLRLTQDSAYRLQLKNRYGDRMLQVQNGRLHFNWLGTEGHPYPRYAQVREGFVPLLAEFERFLADENLGTLRLNQWEVTYVNQIPRGTVWNSPADWGFFRPLSSVPTIDKIVEGESFGGQWHFVIPPQLGRLHAEWRHERSSDHEKTVAPVELIRLTLTARGPIGTSGVATALEGLNLGRATIVKSFRNLMSDEANRYWGLKNGDR